MLVPKLVTTLRNYTRAQFARGRIAGKPKVLILRLRHVPAIDSTGLHALRDVIRRSEREGTLVLLSDVHAPPSGATPTVARETPAGGLGVIPE